MANYRKDSLYRSTQIYRDRFLDIMESPVENISEYPTTTIIIENKYESRPDLLAYDLYGNPKLWWVFALFNQDTLNDPIVDFSAGLELQVPKKFS